MGEKPANMRSPLFTRCRSRCNNFPLPLSFLVHVKKSLTNVGCTPLEIDFINPDASDYRSITIDEHFDPFNCERLEPEIAGFNRRQILLLGSDRTLRPNYHEVVGYDPIQRSHITSPQGFEPILQLLQHRCFGFTALVRFFRSRLSESERCQ